MKKIILSAIYILIHVSMSAQSLIEQIMNSYENFNYIEYQKNIQNTYHQQFFFGIDDTTSMFSESDYKYIQNERKHFDKIINEGNKIFVRKTDIQVCHDTLYVSLLQSDLLFDLFILDKRKRIKWTIECTPYQIFCLKRYPEPIVGRKQRVKTCSKFFREINTPYIISLFAPPYFTWGFLYLVADKIFYSD
ncbi:MAG: hypothetical protein MJ197_08985, partial [Bacteroidales bacterium]|nr:hypothetical protein [Bacteroidales bacterium]